MATSAASRAPSSRSPSAAARSRDALISRVTTSARRRSASAGYVAYATTSGVGTPRRASVSEISSSAGARVRPRKRSPVSGANSPPWRERRTTTLGPPSGSGTAYATPRPASGRASAMMLGVAIETPARERGAERPLERREQRPVDRPRPPGDVSGRRAGRRLHGTQLKTGIGLVRPFSSSEPFPVSFGGAESAFFIDSVRRISPPSARAQSRLAVFTVSPMTVYSSRRSEPMLPANASP